jgi:hypothetical protein
MRRGHVVGVAGFAVAAQLKAAGFAIGEAFQHCETAGFAERQADAIRIERPAWLRRDQLQGIEAEQNAAA